jgi:hypothetical protein
VASDDEAKLERASEVDVPLTKPVRTTPDDRRIGGAVSLWRSRSVIDGEPDGGRHVAHR